MDMLSYIFNEPNPIRKLVRYGIRDLRLGSYKTRYRINALKRMHYAYIIYQAAQLAFRLKMPRISVVEFGVAGGNGLVWMERHAAEIEKIFPVAIEVYGFDTGAGLPPPSDFRDLPYHWKGGFFQMNVDDLQKRLSRAKLILGDVRETAATFFEKFNPVPLGAVSHDLDYYSSTIPTLQLFEAADEFLLPRIFNYFDDTVGNEVELYSDYTGERLAINEFNSEHASRKFTTPYYLHARSGLDDWRFKIWIFQNFAHAHFNDFVSGDNQQLPLHR